MATRSASARRRRRPRARGRLRDVLLAGDRPYGFALVGLVVLVAAMALGPLQVFTASAARVDELEAQRDVLREEVDALEDRERRLEDPEEIELLARSELGLVREGEIPFIVVTPEEDRQRIGRPEDLGVTGEPSDDADLPWYRRAGRWLGDLLGTDG